MKTVGHRDVILINAAFGVLLLIAAALYFWGASTTARIGLTPTGNPELVPKALYEQRVYDKLRDYAVSCNKSQDELAVTVLQSRAKQARETAGILGALGLLLLFNVWCFTMLGREAKASIR